MTLAEVEEVLRATIGTDPSIYCYASGGHWRVLVLGIGSAPCGIGNGESLGGAMAMAIKSAMDAGGRP